MGVVDAFIPNKRKKAGKRFGFVCFIKIFDVERLVNNLCTVKNKFGENRSNTNDYNNEKGVKGVANSYVHAVKGGPQSMNVEAEPTPALVLDEECFNSKDLSNSLLGRVKEFALLSNLKMVLTNEVDTSINDFTIDGRVTWVVIEGWVPDFMEENDEDYDTDGDTKEEGSKGEDASIFGGKRDVEEVPETKFEDRLHNLNLEEVSIGQKDKNSEDPFNLYDLLNKKNDVVDKGNNSENSLKYPPGFTPIDGIEKHCKKDEESKKESGEDSQRYHEEEINISIKDKCSNKKSKEDAAEGVWMKNDNDLLIISDYAPQELIKKYALGLFGLCVNVFNMFIANACLEEVPLGDSSFTWCHKSAPVEESNVMTNMKKKLKHLKQKIREWNKDKKKNARNRTFRFKEELTNLDATIDKELELKMSKEEIKKAVWGCRTDKSPGPEGFTFGFYCRFWKVIEKDVVDAVTYFFTHGFFPKGSNSSFIAFIPKIPDANMVKDFRPISLIGILSKIIAKIFMNRLVVVLGDIVNEVQSAFVKDRQIIDGSFILNELFQSYHLEVLLLSMVVPRRNFNSTRALNKSDVNVDTIVHVLECFFRASGMRINMSKRKLMGIFVEEDKVELAASKIGCLILKPSFSYLGSKVGGLMSRV
nr:RNA-directed DNA polymerase, eukaryota, reverse transcriptase zinc-binding domain protein [Tanacetum cinerariifolium]